MLLKFIHYLPIGTTIFSAYFLLLLSLRIVNRGYKPHLMWWAAGVFFYGLGTAIESMITISGNTFFLNKTWYIAGALLGGYPLAQGTVYLLMQRKIAHLLSLITVPFIFVVSICVILSPVNVEAFVVEKPSGAILAWKWVRWMTPFINLYAAAFLIGGAIYSGLYYLLKKKLRDRAIGNFMIAFGGILPGVGGGLAKAGHVEALYIGELIGIIFIWGGYVFCTRPSKEESPAKVPQ